MKVYELMNELDNMPAGAEVRFRRKLAEDELNKTDDGLYVVDLPIRWAEMEEEVILLDGWKS
ncbi:hypothetical protein KQI11_05760 [Acetanaerobacterium sp. MSJ-12]|uniref:hypothetical protein n=1 Tax=Acetanaerobacterium sp. MSJ-12 TaxID=2841535 RepID=UPI001C0EB156|nr:hypothetical protein [Acetanaerobacterium sp. MSJ-12]MBU5419624.1 hypothetical protein [Acetanaerobacterium sp. MSJ-12]